MAKCPYTDLQSILESTRYKVLVSMEEQHERRANAQRQFGELGMDVEWKTPVKVSSIDWGMLPEIYRSKPKYASQTLTLIEIFEEAKRRDADYFLHLEDDVIFHPRFLSLLPQITVPEDWKFIYLGGRNWGPLRYTSQGLCKGHYIYDLHAVIVRTNTTDLLKRKLLDPKIKSHWADARIAYLHKKHPTYICRPNLAWQSVHAGDSETGVSWSNYNEDGSVKSEQGG